MYKSSKLSQFKVLALAAALSAIPLATHAAGLGRITVLSALGQPLRAQLEVTASRDELNSLTAKLASADAFRVAGIEYAPSLSALNFSRDVRETGGKRYIEISTDRPLNEPFVDMLVELSWASGRLVREYTFLLDPPGLAQKSAPAVVSPPKVDAEPAVAPVKRESPVYISGANGTQSPPREQAVAVPSNVEPAPLKKSPTLAVTRPASDPNRLVKAGDTLSTLATESLPEGVSLDQMLVALFRNNPDAFSGNMNRLHAGKIITVPDAANIRSIDPTEARKEVRAQAADFNAYRQKLAGMAAAAPAKTETSSQEAAGKITPKVEEKQPVVVGKDKLAVSRTEGAKDANGKPLQGRISALEEDIVARDRALRDASGRIAELEKSLIDLKKLAELKSQAGTALQKQAEAKPAASPVVPPAAPLSPVVAKAEQPKPAAAPEAKPESATPPAPVQAPAPGPAEPPKPKKKVVVLPEPEPEPDFIEENAPLVFGGAGVLALLLGYLGFSAYRRKKKIAEPLPQEPVTQASLSESSVFSDAGSHPGSIAASEYSVSESVAGASTEPMDPIVEADTYLAFGRDAQAEEILMDALRAEPARHAVHVKLLEIYSARRSTLQFNTLAKDLYDQTGGRGAEWERVVPMGLALDSGNSMYQPKVEESANEVAAIDLDATMVFTAPPAMATHEEMAPQAVDSADEVAAIDFDLNLGDADTPAIGEVTDTPVPDAAGVDDSGLDFDLDLGEPDVPQVAIEEPAPESTSGMDIDFSLDDPVLPVAVEEKSSTSEAMALDIDFDLEVPTPAIDEGALKSAAIAEVPDETSTIEFVSDLDLPAVETPSSASSEIVEAEAIHLELPATEATSAVANGLDFDFDLGETPPELEMPTAAAEPAIRPIDLSSIDLDLDAPAPVLPSDQVEEALVADNPEAATKLELALAYEEMGDRDGARELLQEVLTEGSSTQQATAQSRLDQLG